LTHKWKALLRVSPCELRYLPRLMRRSRRSGFLITHGTPINFHHVHWWWRHLTLKSWLYGSVNIYDVFRRNSSGFPHENNVRKMQTLTHISTSISRQRNETHFQTAAEAAGKHVLCISPNANKLTNCFDCQTNWKPHAWCACAHALSHPFRVESLAADLGAKVWPRTCPTISPMLMNIVHTGKKQGL